MKWGVRKTKRALDELRTSEKTGSKGAHNHAVAVLYGRQKTHNKQVAKLDRQHAKLTKKQAKLMKKSSKLLANNKTENSDKQSKIAAKQAKLLKKTSRVLKDKATLNKTLKEIDHEFITRGQDFIYMQANGLPYTLATIEFNESDYK